MGIYDVLDDIAKKQVIKSENGDNRILGVVIGRVEKNYSENMKGRVSISIPTRDGQNDTQYWARVAMPSSGDKYGHYFLPEIGDEVLVAFERGNVEKPYVIGCIPRDKDKLIRECAKEKNSVKKIETRNGNSIVFTDDDESNADGDKDKIEIYTPKNEHQLTLDNKTHSITLANKDPKKGSIKMNTENGSIDIECSKKLTIKVGDKIKMTFSGDNGTVELESTSFKVKKVDKIELAPSSKFTVSAPNIKLEGSASISIEGGSTKISGSSISML